nr:iron-containing alcohol dehydrogenase [Bacilli bacterium]
MNIFYRAYCRTFQKIMYLAAFFLNFREPKKYESVGDVPSILKELGVKKALIVTGKTVAKNGIRDAVVNALKDSGIDFAYYDGSKPDPDFACIEEGAKAFLENGCDGLISIGGGSAMDAAKGILARVAYPKKKMSDFGVPLSVGKKLYPHIAVPTTAGTGSEATLAAVITDPEHNHKFAMMSPRLVPDAAILEPDFLKQLPPKTIAATGMDALTHAVESYIGRSGTGKTEAYAVKAVQLIHENLIAFYEKPEEETPRANMLEASYLAGVSFTRAYVGYVHALAHALGGTFHVSHG